MIQHKETVSRFFQVMTGISIGNLATSCAFYAAYNEWHPMVWSAGINATIFVAIALFRAVDV